MKSRLQKTNVAPQRAAQSQSSGSNEPSVAPQHAVQPDHRGQQLLDEIKRLGHYPARSKSNKDEDRLAQKLARAHAAQLFQPDQLAELEELKNGTVQPDGGRLQSRTP